MVWFGKNASQRAQMDLNKKSEPKQETIKTLKHNPQGFKITINKNPSTQEFFLPNFVFPTRDRTGDPWIRSLTRYQVS